MPQLHVVALSDDGRYLVLADDPAAAAGEFQIALDAQLVAAVRGELPRLSSDASTGPPPVTPREIQARVRAGEAPEQIAAEHALPMVKVERYAGPVLSELERMVDQARLAHVVRARRGASILPLGIAVDGRLAEMPGLRPETVSWTARRAPDGEWFVQVRYQVNGRFCEAGWGYDPAARTLVAHDITSAELGHVDSALAGTPAISAVSVPTGAAAADEAPRRELLTVAIPDSVPGPSAATEPAGADWTGADIDPPLPIPAADLVDLPVEWSDGESAFTSALAWSPDGNSPDLADPAATDAVSIDSADEDPFYGSARPVDPADADAVPGDAVDVDAVPGDAVDVDAMPGPAPDADPDAAPVAFAAVDGPTADIESAAAPPVDIYAHAAPAQAADISSVGDHEVVDPAAPMRAMSDTDLTLHVADAAPEADRDAADTGMGVELDDGSVAASAEVYAEPDTASTVQAQALPTIDAVAAGYSGDERAEDGLAALGRPTDPSSTDLRPTEQLPTVLMAPDPESPDAPADHLSSRATPPADPGVPLAVADAGAAPDVPAAAASRARKSKPALEKPVESPAQLKLPVTAKPGARRASPAPRRSSGRATVPSWSDVLLSTVRAEDRDEAAGE